MRRRLLPLTLLCAGTSLSHTALAGNICLLNGDPQLTFPGTTSPDVFGVMVNPETTSGYELYMCSPTNFDVSWLTAYTFGDFNHDGFEDLVFGRDHNNSGGEVVLFLNDKTGSGTVVFSGSIPTGAGVAPTEVDVLDLDGNGWDDILTSNGTDGSFTVMLNSRGNFSSVKQYAVASDVALLAAVDVNGDGLPDVITESDLDQSVSVSLNNGDGTFAAPVTYHIGGSVATLTVGDLNGDGHPDIYVASAGVGGSGYSGPIPSNPGSQKLLNNGDGTFTASAWQPAFGGGSAGGIISITGVGVTVTATSSVGLFGSSATTATPPIVVNSGTGQIKFPDPNVKVVVTKTRSTGKTATTGGTTAGNTKTSAATGSSGGGAMEWLSLMLLGVAGFFRRKRA